MIRWTYIICGTKNRGQEELEQDGGDNPGGTLQHLKTNRRYTRQTQT